MKRTEAMRKGYLAMPSLGERGNEWPLSKGTGTSMEGIGQEGSVKGEVQTRGSGGGGGAEGKLNKLTPGTQFSISKSGEELAMVRV